jgi:REP element-mobilizing transposase RayT
LQTRINQQCLTSEKKVLPFGEVSGGAASPLAKHINTIHYFYFMGFAYTFANPDGVYFVTFTVVEWVDIFTRSRYADIVIESLKYCVAEKGLQLHAFVIMSNHLHLIISRNSEPTLSHIIRDFKKYTATQIKKSIETEPESRRNWMLWIFRQAGSNNPNNKNFQLWQHENHPEELITNRFIAQKLDYIHQNPVRAGIVYRAEDYKYSSAAAYSGSESILPVTFIE